jgi:hypothetical protein
VFSIGSCALESAGGAGQPCAPLGVQLTPDHNFFWKVLK